MLLKEAGRGCAHCDNQIEIATGKESANVVDQRSFLGRLRQPCHLEGGFVEIDRIGDCLVSSSRKRPATALQGSKSGPNECNRRTRRGSAKAASCPAKNTQKGPRHNCSGNPPHPEKPSRADGNLFCALFVATGKRVRYQGKPLKGG